MRHLAFLPYVLFGIDPLHVAVSRRSGAPPIVAGLGIVCRTDGGGSSGLSGIRPGGSLRRVSHGELPDGIAPAGAGVRDRVDAGSACAGVSAPAWSGSPGTGAGGGSCTGGCGGGAGTGAGAGWGTAAGLDGVDAPGTSARGADPCGLPVALSESARSTAGWVRWDLRRRR